MVDQLLLDDGDEAGAEKQPLHKQIPNIITLAGLCAGLAAIQKAFNQQFDDAVLLILASAMLDMLDGALARLLKAQSKFGAQLDSLSDFVCFGVAPALIVHLWAVEDIGKLGWIAVLVYVIACALRLARFNVMADGDDPRPEWARKFFMGVPAPAGAGLCLMPIIFSLQFPFLSILNPAIFLVALWMVFVAVLMISRLPTFSSKQFKWPLKSYLPLLALVGSFFASLFYAPWLTLLVMGTTYTTLIPIAFRRYYMLEKTHA